VYIGLVIAACSNICQSMLCVNTLTRFPAKRRVGGGATNRELFIYKSPSFHLKGLLKSSLYLRLHLISGMKNRGAVNLPTCHRHEILLLGSRLDISFS